MTSSARRAASEAEASDAFRVLARAGYAANGVVHVLIGGIVLAVAFGRGGESDQSGAFKAIAGAPAGFVALWVLAVTLGALGLWHLLEGVLARAGGDDAADAAKKWGRRVSEWGQAGVFLALGAVAASVALGAKPDAEGSAKAASGGVLAVPGGPFLLGAVGLGVGIGGVSFIVMGVLRSFRKKVAIPGGPLGRGITVLGVIGFVAKGVALAIVGVLLLVAAITVDASAAGGLDGAVQALIAVPFGPWLVGAVGVGFVAYGVFCFFRARYAKL